MKNTDATQLSDDTVCDTTRKFVRVISEQANGLVAFEFSIGWPDLAVELVLPRPAFDAFCATHQVRRLDA
jgi:phenol hydroxylase P0 protein